MISKKPLINFIIWIISFLLICIIGASNVFADTTDIGYISNDTQVLVSIPNLGAPVTLNQSTNLNNANVNAIWFNISHTFTKDVLYQVEIYTPNAKLTNINTLGIEYNGGVCNFYGYSDANIGYPKIYFKCPQNTNYISISLRNWDNNIIITGSNFQWNYTYLRSFSDDEELDLGPVISNQNQNTQDIINNQNTNNQNIINNNNQNTQDIINSNKENFESCYDLTINENNLNDYLKYNGYYLNNQNELVENGAYGITDYIQTDNLILTTRIGSAPSVCFYKKDKTLISCISFSTITSDNISLPQDTYYFRSSIVSSRTNQYYGKPTIKTHYCTNKLDEQKNAINNVDNTLKDDNVDENGVADAFDSFNDFLDDNSTITQLITLPITLYTAILNNLNGTCSPFNLGQLYGEDLILPCINISQYLGNSLWTMIDIIISGFAVYAISKKMIKVFNNFSSLREGDVIDD